MIESLDYFATLVQQDISFPLFEAALSIEQDVDPHLDLVASLAELDTLAAKLRQRLPSDASHIQKLRVLNHFFYRELAFGGNVNNYYDPDNSYLHRVISNRRGLPISLAVVYMELAQQIGLEVKGISFPGHFLMKLSVQAGEIIIDPYNGASLSREELEERLEPYLAEHNQHNHDNYGLPTPLSAFLRPAQPREILVRMLRNLKALFSDQQNWESLLAVQKRLVILLPDNAAELRDRGLAYANLECPQAALSDLEAYLLECPDAPDADALNERLPDIREACKKFN